MSSWAAEIRRREAARRRAERDAGKRQRELERRLKERALLSALEEARLEVDLHEQAIQELLSVHKEQEPRIEWATYAAALPPTLPLRVGRHEFAERLRQDLPFVASPLDEQTAVIERARQLDEEEYQAQRKTYSLKLDRWLRGAALAKRVLEGKPSAYTEVLAAFAEVAATVLLGSTVEFTVHSSKTLACALTVVGREIVPQETKTLTATGKLSVKAIPKGQALELYQDYVCGCVLRVAREAFAVLPVDTALVTASVPGIDQRTGSHANLPVLSVLIDRARFERLNFLRLDPSDSLENFVHRGDAKTLRRSGDFVPIIPLTAHDLRPNQPERMDFTNLLTSIRQLRAEIGPKIRLVPDATLADAEQEAVEP